MSDALAPRPPAGDLIGWSLAGSVAVVFPKSRSPNYDAALNLAEQAEHYATSQIGRTTFHLAGFGRTRDQAARALAVIRYLRSIKGFQVFAGGAVLQDWHRVESVLRCYIDASGCADPRAHCIVMIERERLFERAMPSSISITIGGPPAEPRSSVDLDWMDDLGREAFPCRYLLHNQFRLQKGHPSSAAEQIQAGAVREGCDWCPNFQTGGSGR